MNHNPIKVFICLVFIFLTNNISAIYSIHGVDKLDLSNNAVLCMFQDQEGYMWFGTYDGLNLFNGEETFIYRFEPDNEFSLSSNIIHKVSQAGDNYLWISTFLGLDKFSLTERKVIESYPQYPEARLLVADKEGNTWIVNKKNYLSYYTPKSKRIDDIHCPGVSVENVLSLFINEEGKLSLVMTDGTLKTVGLANNTQSDIEINDLKIHPEALSHVYYENRMLYFVSDGQVYLYDVVHSKKELLIDISSIISTYGNLARFIFFKENIYLVLTNGSFIELDRAQNYKPEVITSGIGIFCLLKDHNQDILWIGTDGRGVQMYYQYYEMFRNVMLDHLPGEIKRPIRAIYTDEFDNLWIGTKGDGLIQIKEYEKQEYQELNAIKYNRFTTETGLSNNLVFCFSRSRYRDILWIGTDGPGFSYYSYKDGKVRSLQGLAANQIGKVHSICEIDDSTLWLATAGNGLLEVIVEGNNSQLAVRSVNAFFPKKGENVCNEFHSMRYDGNSILFVGSRGGYGVLCFNIYTKQYEFIQMDKTGNSAIGDILCVHQAKDSIFYIGASSGMTRMEFGKDGRNVIKQFDRRDGIANDMIHGILEDDNGCIWLSTNKGLTKYNPHNNFFHNYSGSFLKVTEFSDDAYWRSTDKNRLFFGGINGLVWIDADNNPEQNKYKPDIYFFDITISEKSHTISSYTNPKGYLEIPADISSFTISFAALDYIDGKSYEYSYALENYNTDWTDLQKNKVTFTNLPHGRYELKVRYKSDVFDSDASYYVLPIIKLPPWYFTFWALLGYFVVISIILAYSIYLGKKKIEAKQLALARKIKEEQKDKLIEAKLNFFTNVTHEFCTPLTVINGVTGFIEKLATENNNLKQYTHILKENVKSLNNLIQEILDFRKMEESKLRMRIIKDVSIHDLIHRQMESFITISKQNNIDLKISVPDDLYWDTDVSYFNRILINLVSNAFKYSNDDARIKVSAYSKDNLLCLKVYNTGKGIESSMIPYIFDRYRIVDNIETNSYAKHSTRNGVGLSICMELVRSLQGNIEVESEINKYAEFTVALPLPQFAASDKVNTETLQADKQKQQTPQLTDKPFVLVIDDNKDIVWMISDALKNEYNIKGVYSVEEALKVIEGKTPDLIVTDIMMPGMNGIEFIEHLKLDRFTKHIPLIIISAKISDHEQAEGLNVGGNAYFTKPFSMEVLASAIARLLSTRTELKEYFYSPESAYRYTEGQLMHQEDKEFIDMITSIIDSNLEEENLRPEFIAEKLGMNTRTLYRRFKKISSVSPNDFIKDYRFNTAAKLLVSTNLTIQEIIYKVGISNKSYFYREFLKKYKTTPKDFRLKQEKTT